MIKCIKIVEKIIEVKIEKLWEFKNAIKNFLIYFYYISYTCSRARTHACMYIPIEKLHLMNNAMSGCERYI